MQDLNDLLYFVEVVDQGGFAAAGRSLNVPKSKLSRRVAELESRLGVRLLQRTTRKLSLTAAGEIYHRHCVAMREQAEAADEAVADATEASGGGAAGGSICDRAQRCCEAYVNEMNAMSPGMVNTATTCAGIAAARDTPFADTTCQSTIDGFRSGLTGAQRTVPADCAAQ